MKTKYSKVIFSFLLMLGVLVFQGCDLEEELFDETTPEQAFKSPAAVSGAVVPVYAAMRAPLWSVFNYSEVTTDEAVVPTRATDWDDAGRWREMHNHAWGPLSPGGQADVPGVWNNMNAGIATANDAISSLETISPEENPAIPTLIAEVRTLRAWYYFWLMDFFGGVPIETGVPDPQDPPAHNSRSEVFDFVVSELQAALPDLEADPPYGRVSKGTANTLLAKAYLNSEVYTGTARFAECIAACDAVINSGVYSLEPNYFDNFTINNDASNESILVAEYSNSVSLGENMNFYMRTLHYHQVTASPWNGFSTLASFLATWDGVEDANGDGKILETDPAEFAPSDPRFGTANSVSVITDGLPLHQGFLVGQQQDNMGNKLNDRKANPLFFTIEFDALSLTADNLEDQGVRVTKYEVDQGAPGGQGGNDMVWLRLGDVYLMKAEAALRNGDAATALTNINIIRARARGAGTEPADLAAVTLDDIYAERGYELYWESWRRNDMIRFGTFNDAYSLKEADASDHVNLLPIPQEQIDANPKLTQNPGY